MFYSGRVFGDCLGHVPIVLMAPAYSLSSCLLCLALSNHGTAWHRALDEVFLVLMAWGVVGVILYGSIQSLQANIDKYEVR